MMIEKKAENGDIRISELIMVCLAAALVFFSVFWSIRHPANSELFSLLALVFLIPQLCFPSFWRVISARFTPIILGALFALVCAMGSLFELQTARMYVYASPWFLVIVAYFNLSCLAITYQFLSQAGKAIKSKGAKYPGSLMALALLHLSFVIVCGGMAIDGYCAKRGYFATSLKRAPRMMPETGLLEKGESTSKMLVSDKDPGTELPFTLKLESFNIEYFPEQSVTLIPGQDSQKLSGIDFTLLGVVFDQMEVPVVRIPVEKLESCRLALQVSMRGDESRILYIGLDETSLRDYELKFVFDEHFTGDFLSEYALVIIAPGIPKQYTSIVDVLVNDDVVMDNFEIRVNHPLEFKGYKVYQSSWAEVLNLDEWEALPTVFHSPEKFKQYLRNNEIPPCTLLSIAITPGRDFVYVGYALMFLSMLAMLAIPRRKNDEPYNKLEEKEIADVS